MVTLASLAMYVVSTTMEVGEATVPVVLFTMFSSDRATKLGSVDAPAPARTVPTAPAAVMFTALVPSPRTTPWAVKVAAPVPPLATTKVPVRVNVAPLPEVVRPVVPPVTVTVPDAAVATPESPVKLSIAATPKASAQVAELEATFTRK